MVLKNGKRALENALSCQPVKHHKQLEYSVDKTDIILENVPNNLFSKVDPSEHSQVDNIQRVCANDLWSSSRSTILTNGISYSEDLRLLEKDKDCEKLVEDVKADDECSVRTDLTNSQNSVCGHKEDQCIDSQVSIQAEDMEETVLTNGTVRASGMYEDELETPHQRVFGRLQAKDIDTCMSISSVDKCSSRVTENFDSELVSAPSRISEEKLSDAGTVMQDCKGSDKMDHSLPPFVSDSGDFCSKTFAMFDCNEEHCSNCESTYGLGGYPRKRVPIGPEFQVELPVCKPKVCVLPCDSSDIILSQSNVSQTEVDDRCSSFVGHRVWPLAGSNVGFNDCSIGQGRSIECTCHDSTSIRCVKEHIEVQREKLKLELGEAFSLWGFDDMGEIVSEKWTRQEEETFWELVSMNPISANKNFWNYLSLAFPSRSKEELVSYYFNVFVLRRRALQNRVDPANIDSDDDEEDWHCTEVGLKDRLMMTEDDDDSEEDSESSEGDNRVEESDEEMENSSGEEDEKAASCMSGHVINRLSHRFFCDQENRIMDSEDDETHDVRELFSFPFQHKLDHNNNINMTEGRDFQDQSCMSMEWNHEKKPSGLICIRSAGDLSVQGENCEVAPSSDDACKKEKQVDLSYGNDIFYGDGKLNGNLSHKEDFAIDGHSSLLEPYDSKLWDIALVTSLKTDTDRLVSTCSLIKELFGDENKENDRNRV